MGDEYILNNEQEIGELDFDIHLLDEMEPGTQVEVDLIQYKQQNAVDKDEDYTITSPVTRIEALGTWTTDTTPQGCHLKASWTSCEELGDSLENKSRAKKRLWTEVELATEQLQPELLPNTPSASQTTASSTICPFCLTKINKTQNFTRHLKRQHKEQEMVKTLMKLTLAGSARKEIQKVTTTLRKLGRYKYMQKHGSETPLPCKRSKAMESLVTCSYCLGAYNPESFRCHWRTCPQRPITHLLSTTEIQGSSDFESTHHQPHSNRESSKLHANIVPHKEALGNIKLMKAQNLIFKSMQLTEAGKVAVNDELILKFAAQRLPGVDKDQGKLDYFRQGVRDLSNLLIEIKKIDPTIKKLRDCFLCCKFDKMMDAVYKLSETDYLAGTVKKTSMNNRLRPPIGVCCSILLSEARKSFEGSERDKRIRELELFNAELNENWAKQFGTLAENQKKENRHGRVINCADPEDVSMVFNHCDKYLPEETSALKSNPITSNYDKVIRMVALSMYTTSRRRSCDLQKLTVSDYMALEKNVELCEKVGANLKLSEELLKKMSSLYCIFSCGKDQLPTAILLTENMRNAIDTLLGVRAQFKINSDRIFIKFNPSAQPWKVDSAIEWAKKSLPMKDPINFGVRGIRHLTGTIGQTMTDKDPEIEAIFREGLSHSEAVSKRYYRGNLASRIIQGYGLPLLEKMTSRPMTSHTATSTEPSNDEMIVSLVEHSKTSQGNPNPTPSEPDKDLEEFCESPVNHQRDIVEDDSSDDINDPDFVVNEYGKNKTNDSQAEKLFHRDTPIVRTAWSSEEDTAVVRQFYNVIKMERRVSTEEIVKAKHIESVLRSRTDAQIRARISSIRRQSSTQGQKLFKLINSLDSPDAKKYGK